MKTVILKISPSFLNFSSDSLENVSVKEYLLVSYDNIYYAPFDIIYSILLIVDVRL